MKVCDGIHRLTQGVTNFYVIEESGKYTLADAGTPRDWDYFVRALASLGGRQGWQLQVVSAISRAQAAGPS